MTTSAATRPCPFCGANGASGTHGHDCWCVRRAGEGRVAVGVCCGRDLGASLLAEEDFHDGAPWAQAGDCTCPELEPEPDGAERERARREGA